MADYSYLTRSELFQMLMNQKNELGRQLRIRNATIEELATRMKNLIQTINSVWIANQM